MEISLIVEQGQFELRRLPERNNEVLRAWDAADEYLLQAFESRQWPVDPQILIVNDAFGALAVPLSRFKPVAISDSWLSHQATRYNLQVNAIASERVMLLNSLQLPVIAPDIVLLKIPKTVALLEYQLLQLKRMLKPDSVLLAAGMVKHIAPSVWSLIEKIIGPVTTSLARKKARILTATNRHGERHFDNPYPVCYQLENTHYQICNHANVFSRDSLDIGTRFLLQHLPADTHFDEYIDLGCGNGVIGLMLADRFPAAHIKFVDESFMAIASAKMNFIAAFGAQRSAEFISNDCLSGFRPSSADCIVCNPPFHQQQTIGTHIAGRMFKQAYQVLRQGGELRVIGNRHLPYGAELKRIFGQTRVVAQNRKFTIWTCRR